MPLRNPAQPDTSAPAPRALPELLAPAGNWSCLRAALDAGCDAVYFGTESLNMRSGAENFARADLPAIRKLCSQHGVKAYLALNTIVYSGELAAAEQLLACARDHVDGVICWDPAVVELARQHGVPIHISTQASVANVRAAMFYKRLGARRIVAARECSLEEVAAIRREAEVEVEVFVHGAMCVSVSGRCFLSQFTDGKSGNRGECRQHCRREYRILADDDTAEFRLGPSYLLSAKDLCTIPFIDVLLDAGLDGFKIEGRNRPPEYVHTVVGTYRKAMDAWASGRLDDARKTKWIAECRTVFNRDFSEGFYMGRPIGEMTTRTGSQATLRKDYVGKVTNYFKQAKVAEIDIRDYGVEVGDRLLIDGPTSGAVIFDVRELRQNKKPTMKAGRGTTTVPLQRRVRTNDRVYRLSPRNPAADARPAGRPARREEGDRGR